LYQKIKSKSIVKFPTKIKKEDIYPSSAEFTEKDKYEVKQKNRRLITCGFPINL